MFRLYSLVIMIFIGLTTKLPAQGPTRMDYHPESAVVLGATLDPQSIDAFSTTAIDQTQLTVSPLIPSIQSYSLNWVAVAKTSELLEITNFDHRLDAWYNFAGGGSFDLSSHFGMAGAISEARQTIDRVLIARQEYEPQSITGEVPYTSAALDLLAEITTPVGAGVAGDVNGDGLVNIADPIYLLHYLNGTGEPPVGCTINTSTVALNQFVNVYGTHLVTQQTRGHFVYAHIQVRKLTNIESSVIEAALSVAIDGAVAGGSSGFSYTEAIDILQQHTEVAFEVRGTGGGGLADLSGVIQFATVEDLDDVTMLLEGYVAGLDYSNSALFSYTLARIPELDVQSLENLSVLAFQRLECLGELALARRFGKALLDPVNLLLDGALLPWLPTIPDETIDLYLGYRTVYQCYVEAIDEAAFALVQAPLSEDTIPASCASIVPDRFGFDCDGTSIAFPLDPEFYDLGLDTLEVLIALGYVGSLPPSLQHTMDQILNEIAPGQFPSPVLTAAVRDSLFLDLSESDVQSLYPLQFMTGLQEVNLSSNPIAASQLRYLRELPNLRSLNLDNTPVTTLIELSGATQLEELSLNVSGITSLSGAETFTSLEVLSFEATNVTDLDELSGLTRLQRVVANHTLIGSVNGLANKPFLTHCNIGHTQVGSITPLRSSLLLEDLILYGLTCADQGRSLVDNLGAAIAADIASGQAQQIVTQVTDAGLATEFEELFELRYPGSGDWTTFFAPSSTYDGLCCSGRLSLGCIDPNHSSLPSEAAIVSGWRVNDVVSETALVRWWNQYP